MDIGEYSVTVNQKDTVTALLPVQQHRVPLSNLDLLLPPLDVGVFFCYKKPTNQNSLTFSSMVSTLKKSLAQALVSFNVLSGEVVMNSAGEPEILCNNRGVDFFEAYADVEFRDLELYNPDANVEGKLVPKKKEGVLCVQATELKCGAAIIACTFDHRIADAYSMNMFLVTWAEMAQSKPISIYPFLQRSLLNPRPQGSYDSSINKMYVPISSMPPPSDPVPGADHVISRIYSVASEDIVWLQAQVSIGGTRRSKLESLSAFLWQIVAKSEKDGTKRIKMGTVVDGRTRLSVEYGESMFNYFGNVLSIPFGDESVEELTRKPLNWVAGAVHEYVKGAATKEHFLGLIDWVEVHRPEPGVTKIYVKGREDGAAFVMSSGQRFPVKEVDFGWGRPVFGSYHFPWGGESGYVMPLPSASREGDWVIYMHLMKSQLDCLEVNAGHIFRPLTADYLGLA
ncbi:coniferyl alcohol acyltransferase-like [Tasmannia lanceolata]|uniref:coniferyl alcohol acyltransferase-like n=1 Tax=Tasmannia lanceolata TaxID=3420 RepID=UPI0040635E5A